MEPSFSSLPPPRPANWSVYNTFNYPVRSFAVGKLTPGARRVTDDGPCTHLRGEADRKCRQGRELPKPTLGGTIYHVLQDYAKIYTPSRIQSVTALPLFH